MATKLLITETSSPKRPKWMPWDKVPVCRWVYCRVTGCYCLKGGDGDCLISAGPLLGYLQSVILNIPAKDMREDNILSADQDKPETRLYRLCNEVVWRWCKEGLPVNVIDRGLTNHAKPTQTSRPTTTHQGP